jgi:peptidoglycan/LPS O-acetylase OafA/YrhL
MKPITATTSTDRLLPGIHGLRAVAALMVLLFHLAPLSNLALPEGIGFVGAYFGLGVTLFYVLSAFSLCHSTLISIDRPGWTRDYFIKRFFRIAPLFYVMLAAWYALFYYRNAAPGLGDVLLNLVFAFNFVPEKYESIVAAGWTVGVEMVFYAVFPVILLLVGRLRHAIVFFVLASFVSLVARMSLEKAGMGAYVGGAFISALGIFAAGVLAFWVYRWLKNKVIRENSSPRKWLWLAVAIPATAFLAIVSPARHWLFVWGRADIMLFSVFFGGMAVWQALFPSRFLASKPMTFMGERSYSIYLLHPWIMFWFLPANQWLYAKLEIVIGSWAFLANAFFTMTVTVMASAIAWRFIEKPGMECGKRLIARLRNHGEAAEKSNRSNGNS